MTNIKNFDSSLVSIKQISFKSTDDVICGIEYIAMKSCDSENSHYLVFNSADAYTEENNEDKYLVFAFADENKKALENYTELWDEVKNQIEMISDNIPTKYEKDLMKIK